MSDLEQLESDVQLAMQKDKHRLRRLLRFIRQSQRDGKPVDRSLDKLTVQLAESRALRDRRRDSVPPIEYVGELPVIEHRERIGTAIRENQVVIVCGETGSGKSTQLPKICLELGRGVDGLIGHTQPRRIAARSIASRVAQELQTKVGDRVGFKIRFTDKTDPTTLVKLMTDGVMLAETLHDRFLDQYDTIIVDEAHERSLNIDFLMGYLKRLLPRRPDLKLIITSATIDAERFAEHFGCDGEPAPVILVEGRTYPVEVLYRPLDDEMESAAELHQAVADAVQEAARIDRGDMLVFLPTERDIRETARVLRGRSLPGDGAAQTEILPLYSRLSNEQQNRVFQPHPHRRVVLATNVAESSLTVPRIKFVIDTGLARISRYSSRSKVQRLPVEAISRASADQRQGRCGRIGPGVCFRMFSEDDYLQRDEYTTPEIRRTNLAAVILRTMALKLGAIDDFPFLDPPRPDRVRDGYRTLYEIGAIDERRELTDLGRQLSRLPVDPRIGRMILAAEDEHCLHEVLIIAAALEIQDPRERPVDKQQAADEQHARFVDPQSDFISYLNLWDFYHEQREKLSHNRLRKMCQQCFLSYNRMREWTDIFRQLREMVQTAKMRPRKRSDDYDAIHRALLTGLLSNVATKTEKFEYTGAGGGKFHLWPGAGVFQSKPQWVIAGELLETSRRYLRNVARIDPDWIEPIGDHLVKRSFSDPHWSKKAGAAMAYEKVTLFGLTVVAKRRVPLAPLDQEEARRLLVEEGLAEGAVRTSAFFYRQNRRLLEDIAQLRDKTRKREFIVDPWKVIRFYDDRLPDHIVDVGKLNGWAKERSPEVDRLVMTRDDLLDADEDDAQSAFPDQLESATMKLDIHYRFQPGENDDGVTVVVPQEGLAQLSEQRLSWLVPGLLEDKVLALIRTLPKTLRRNFVPAPDVAREIAGELPFGEGPLLSALGAALTARSGEAIRAEDFDESRLPQHLLANVRVVDEQGDVAAGRDVRALRRELGVGAAGPEVVVRNQAWNRDGATKWDFGELPESIELERGGAIVSCFPTLVDRGDSVSLRLYDSQLRAAAENRRGLRRLFCIAEHRELKSQVQWLPQLDRLLLYGASLGDPQTTKQHLGERIADRAFFSIAGVPHCDATYSERCKYARAEIGPATQDVLKVVAPLMENYQQARLALESAPATHRGAVDDARSQLDELSRPGFLVETPWEWFVHLPRFLQALALRIEKLRAGAATRDDRGIAELQPHLRQLADWIDERGDAVWFDHELVTYRWMLEEFRVSLFAQELGTSRTVSSQRLDKQWAKVGVEL
ncbi:MAG: ATP-dependent RNA helicase HrpA [Pirellulaceae bacterium]|jgi:ATP-dependent helicase HrpA|nr:ATP-dependent RNA helicase HrpA [Pirellulaceae bacterium]MDP7016294.1 ATP-dependent RNA helicase HrpA [Pirellulaceae bacterium]